MRCYLMAKRESSTTHLELLETSRKDSKEKLSRDHINIKTTLRYMGTCLHNNKSRLEDELKH
jgi:hypothetical protein